MKKLNNYNRHNWEEKKKRIRYKKTIGILITKLGERGKNVKVIKKNRQCKNDRLKNTYNKKFKLFSPMNASRVYRVFININVVLSHRLR